ncbi:MAG: symmetrical bis(5'-nucleosyl)-tetraphosphatase [Gammaproteobacteria bacterium]|nr:symmetrical bis(5'-nucleosyl)-tetraphosphatase [Gammaproteobacteria bacterium]
MATYVIGDIQGCRQEFEDILESISFDSGSDKLWLTGDIINRGPDSLGALRLAKHYNVLSVLGNHECHLLAVANDVTNAGKKDTLQAIINADDGEELLDWIRHFPLIHHNADLGFTMVHAGLHPQWNLSQSLQLSHEVETVMQSDNFTGLLANMYGDTPDQWHDELNGWERLRCIINYCTRSRYYKLSGKINLKDKGPPGSQKDGYYPWYSIEERKMANNSIVFGHWASLHDGDPRQFESYNIYPLDTGCVWGRKLTALRLEDKCIFQVPSIQQQL